MFGIKSEYFIVEWPIGKDDKESLKRSLIDVQSFDPKSMSTAMLVVRKTS